MVVECIAGIPAAGSNPVGITHEFLLILYTSSTVLGSLLFTKSSRHSITLLIFFGIFIWKHLPPLSDPWPHLLLLLAVQKIWPGTDFALRKGMLLSRNKSRPDAAVHFLCIFKLSSKKSHDDEGRWRQNCWVVGLVKNAGCLWWIGKVWHEGLRQFSFQLLTFLIQD